MSPEEPRWRTLLSQIRAVQMELKRRSNARVVGLAGHAAAPRSAIVVAELRLGRRLPPSYREFLSFSDGWPDFFEGASLLGTAELGRVPVVATGLVAQPPARLLPFGVGASASSLFAFDTSARRADGEMPIVAWVGGLGIDCLCFTGFLSTVLQLCRSELFALDPKPPAASLRGRKGPGKTVEKSWSTGTEPVKNTEELLGVG